MINYIILWILAFFVGFFIHDWMYDDKLMEGENKITQQTCQNIKNKYNGKSCRSDDDCHPVTKPGNSEGVNKNDSVFIRQDEHKYDIAWDYPFCRKGWFRDTGTCDLSKAEVEVYKEKNPGTHGADCRIN